MSERLPGDRAAPLPCPWCCERAVALSERPGLVLGRTCSVCDGTGLRPPPLAQWVIVDGESLPLYGPFGPPGGDW